MASSPRNIISKNKTPIAVAAALVAVAVLFQRLFGLDLRLF